MQIQISKLLLNFFSALMQLMDMITYALKEINNEEVGKSDSPYRFAWAFYIAVGKNNKFRRCLINNYTVIT